MARFVGLVLTISAVMSSKLTTSRSKVVSHFTPKTVHSSKGCLLLTLKLALAYVSSFSDGSEVRHSSWLTLSYKSLEFERNFSG